MIEYSHWKTNRKSHMSLRLVLMSMMLNVRERRWRITLPYTRLVLLCRTLHTARCVERITLPYTRLVLLCRTLHTARCVERITLLYTRLVLLCRTLHTACCVELNEDEDEDKLILTKTKTAATVCRFQYVQILHKSAQWVTLNLDFKVTIFFNVKYLENGT